MQSAGIAFLALLVAALAIVRVPPDNYMYRICGSMRDWRVERAMHSVPALLAADAGRVAPAPARSSETMTAALPWNTAVSFVVALVRGFARPKTAPIG
jgi:hypothetical protein